MTTTAQRKAIAKYDAENTKQIMLKLNKKTDADVLEALETVANRQGYIKELVRNDLAQKRQLEHAAETFPVAYVFREYKDRGGIGSEQMFRDKYEAIKTASDHWETMNEYDRDSYRRDAAGVFAVWLMPCEWDDIDDCFYPEGDPISVEWDALAE